MLSFVGAFLVFSALTGYYPSRRVALLAGSAGLGLILIHFGALEKRAWRQEKARLAEASRRAGSDK